MTSADVETQTGTTVDYAAWNDVARTDWCKSADESDPNDDADITRRLQEGEEEAEATCVRQSVSTWQKLLTDAATNYPISHDAATSMSSATCTARRLLSTPNAYMEVKTGVAHTVTSGYKLYATGADYDSGAVKNYGAGTAQEFTFEAATTLFAGVAVLTATILA